jgi:hypothetical protein
LDTKELPPPIIFLYLSPHTLVAPEVIQNEALIEVPHDVRRKKKEYTGGSRIQSFLFLFLIHGHQGLALGHERKRIER